MIKTIEECKLIKKCANYDIASPEHRNNKCLGYAKDESGTVCRKCKRCKLHTYKLEYKD